MLSDTGYYRIPGWSRLWLTIVLAVVQGNPNQRKLGPVFMTEPPNHLSFLNTTGVTVDCLAYGTPSPRVGWRLKDGMPAEDVPGLRQTLANGTLVLWSFNPKQYRQDIHAAIYVCQAENEVGTIVSRDVHVRGVVKQFYEVQVYDEFVIRGNTAVLRCHIPSFVKDYVYVTSWIRDDIVPIVSDSDIGGRFSVYPSGELHIRNATLEDGSPQYRCQTTHRLTRTARLSDKSGRLSVTDSSGTVPPRFTDHRTSFSAFEGESLEIPCAAQGLPLPRYSWYRYARRNGTHLIPLYLEPRIKQLSGSLLYRTVNVEDSGKYVCVVSNSAGEERQEIVLTVNAHLTARMSPQQQSIDVGKSATFNCSYSGHPVNSVSWLKDGKPLIVDGDRVRLLTWVNLNFERVVREDGGMYQCLVSNDFESAQATGQLVLGEAGPVFHYIFSEQTLQPGHFHSLKCVASGTPTPQITWTLDGVPLGENQNFRVGDYITSRDQVVSYVNFTSLRVEDGGQYGCVASNDAGTVTHVTGLNVFGLPYIRPMKDVSAVAGETLVLRCPVAGYPIESIAWSTGGSGLPTNRRQEVFQNGTLVIQDVQKGVDDGPYTCRAKNKQGQSASGTVRIRVMVKPIIEPFHFPRNLQEGMRARLVCTIIQGDPPFLYRWTKNGRSIQPDLGVVNRDDDFSSDLTFPSINPNHNGNYTCTVSNAAAAVSHTALLVVNVPPKWEVEPRDTSVVSGHTVRVDCLAKGFPTPVMTWERGSAGNPRLYTSIASGPHYEVHSNGSLFIKNALEMDGGYYLCQSNNKIGSGLSKVIYLTVHVPPRFETKFRSETVHKGERVLLRCEAIGDHPMTIVWNVDKQPLNPTEDARYELKEIVGNKRMSSEVVILSAERRDSVLFTCLASNAFGRDDHNIRLIVREPPEPPREVRLLEQKSRSAKLTWSLPYNGNSAITKFIISCKTSPLEKPVNASVSSDETTAVIRGLRPARTYSCYVQAENIVGVGESSEQVAVTTSEEVPGGPPLSVEGEPMDSQSIRVTWKPPEDDLWNGPIRGYYIGYKVYESEDPYLYKTLELNSDKVEEVTLTPLQKFTRYSILVQAYNSMGAGPRSDEIIVRTMEDVPSQPPQEIRCSPFSSQGIQVSWEPPPRISIHGNLQGYKVTYKITDSEEDSHQDHLEKLVTPQEIQLGNLLKFTNYTIRVSAYNQKGEGIASEPVYCKTLEDVPGPPTDIKAVVMAADSVLILWKKPKNPNGIITKYALYWRGSANAVKNATMIPINPNQLQYKVLGLRENSRHEFWVTTFTSRGESKTTRVVSQTTTRRVPARIINFGEEIKAIAGDPASMPCVAVGVEPIKRKWKYTEHEKTETTRIEILADGTLTIKKVHNSDANNYTCQVHNLHGVDEISYRLVVKTITHKQIQIKVISTTTSSVQIEILQTTENHPVRGYEARYQPANGEWRHRHVSGRNHVTVDQLQCGAEYQLFLFSEGRTERSNTVTFRTQGSAPVAPKKEEFVSANATHIFLHLNAWQNGACPLSHLAIEYRPHKQIHWNTLTKHVSPEHQSHLSLSNLTPDTWYVLRIVAHNEVGTTPMEYDVLTVSPNVGDPRNKGGSATSLFFEDTTTLVSMASSGIVLIAGVVAVVCLVMYKRRRNTRHHCRGTRSSGETSSRSDVATTTSLMANLEKKSQRSETSRHIQSQSQSQSHNRDMPSYFSSPVRKVAPTNNLPSARPLNSPSTSRSTKPQRKSVEYDEAITPYATFRLPDSTTDDNENPPEEFKTFSLRHGEPSYMLKSSLDAPSSKNEKEELYHSQAHNSHSLTSGSSNQEELMRAYEYARRQPPLPLHYDSSSTRNQSRTSGTATTESEATDPGIRQFSGTPPRPNERRQGACLTPGLSVVFNEAGTSKHQSSDSSSSSSSSSSTSDESTPVNTPCQPRSGGMGGGLHGGFSAGLVRERPRNWSSASAGVNRSRSQSQPQQQQQPLTGTKKQPTKAIKKGLSSDESDSDGTLYTFNGCNESAPLRGNSGNELSETDCDRDKLSRLSTRGAFPRRPPIRTRTKADIINC